MSNTISVTVRVKTGEWYTCEVELVSPVVDDFTIQESVNTWLSCRSGFVKINDKLYINKEYIMSVRLDDVEGSQ